MGMWFRFICDVCAYEARVSGGCDAGMMVGTPDDGPDVAAARAVAAAAPDEREHREEREGR